jgi:MSHA biogenesis protein MshP
MSAGILKRSMRARVQSGFALMSAIFLITVLFLLSAYMVSIRVSQEASVSLDTLATRAYAAARSGIEWGIYNSLRNGACAASTTIALGGTLSGYTVTVTCATSGPYNEGGTLVSIDTIVATACNNAVCPQPAPAPNYVERQITTLVGR